MLTDFPGLAYIASSLLVESIDEDKNAQHALELLRFYLPLLLCGGADWRRMRVREMVKVRES
jgi:hypothetical protein